MSFRQPKLLPSTDKKLFLSVEGSSLGCRKLIVFSNLLPVNVFTYFLAMNVAHQERMEEKVIPLKLFLDMLLRFSADVATCASRMFSWRVKLLRYPLELSTSAKSASHGRLQLDR